MISLRRRLWRVRVSVVIGRRPQLPIALQAALRGRHGTKMTSGSATSGLVAPGHGRPAGQPQLSGLPVLEPSLCARSSFLTLTVALWAHFCSENVWRAPRGHAYGLLRLRFASVRPPPRGLPRLCHGRICLRRVRCVQADAVRRVPRLQEQSPGALRRGQKREKQAVLEARRAQSCARGGTSGFGVRPPPEAREEYERGHAPRSSTSPPSPGGAPAAPAPRRGRQRRPKRKAAVPKPSAPSTATSTRSRRSAHY